MYQSFTLNTIMNAKRTIYITATDMTRLRALITAHRDPREDIKTLAGELDRAQVVAPSEVPRNVITMNSEARLREVETNEEITYRLVFPEQANIDERRISVLAPIGTAMLGQREGDEFQWEVPEGLVRLRVEKVMYQPEAAGHYHL